MRKYPGDIMLCVDCHDVDWRPGPGPGPVSPAHIGV